MIKKILFLTILLSSTIFAADITIEENKLETKYSKIYVQPECITTGAFSKSYNPAIGIGYRVHKKYHGGDFSIHLMGTDFEGGYTLFPFIKGSYLLYPFYSKNNEYTNFYLGIGASACVWLPIPFPVGTIGYECPIGKKTTFFIQIDQAAFPIRIFSIGVSF
jgi:hypothetical protein